ncbi:MAG: glycosyltransferase [Bdellovibrionota bacterium]
MTAKKILLVIKTLGVGGAERLILQAAPCLSKSRNFSYSVLFLSEPSSLAGEIEKRGIPVSGAGFRGSLPTPSGWRSLKSAAQQADLVHAHLPVTGFFSLLAAGGKPVVYTEHTIPTYHHPLTRLAGKWAYPKYTRLIGVSGAVADAVSKISGKSALVIENGVDLLAFQNAAAANLPVPADAPVLLMLGRLVPDKNPLLAVRVMKRIAEEFPKAHLLFAGEGPLQSECEKETKRLGLGERVHFLGLRSDVPGLLAKSMLVLNTSRVEGHPIGLIEAQAAGKAAVAPQAGGVPEVIRAGETGILYPAGDEEACAKAVVELLKNQKLRDQMGEAGRKNARERFDIARWVERHEALYEEILQDGGCR